MVLAQVRRGLLQRSPVTLAGTSAIKQPSKMISKFVKHSENRATQAIRRAHQRGDWEVVPLPYLLNRTSLPAGVGNGGLLWDVRARN